MANTRKLRLLKEEPLTAQELEPLLEFVDDVLVPEERPLTYENAYHNYNMPGCARFYVLDDDECIRYALRNHCGWTWLREARITSDVEHFVEVLKHGDALRLIDHAGPMNYESLTEEL